jgi:hypothetical protein
MRYCRISVLSVLAAVTPSYLAKILSPRWNDMHTRHSWNIVPRNWECLGAPPGGTTIDLYIALEPHNETALIHALYRVSDPDYSGRVLHHSCPLKASYALANAMPRVETAIPRRSSNVVHWHMTTRTPEA